MFRCKLGNGCTPGCSSRIIVSDCEAGLFREVLQQMSETRTKSFWKVNDQLVLRKVIQEDGRCNRCNGPFRAAQRSIRLGRPRNERSGNWVVGTEAALDTPPRTVLTVWTTFVALCLSDTAERMLECSRQVSPPSKRTWADLDTTFPTLSASVLALCARLPRGH